MRKNLIAIIIALMSSANIHLAIALQSDQANNTEVSPNWHQNIALEDGRSIVAMPAEYQIIEIQHIIQPAQVIEKQIPAVTKQVQRRIIKSPAKTIEKLIPAVIETVNRRVIDKPARTRKRTIRKVTKDLKVFNPLTGSKTKKTIVIQPEHQVLEVVPATYKIIQQQLVVKEEQTQKINIPAEYDNVVETVVVSEARTEKTVIPAVTKMKTETVEIAPPRLVLKSNHGDIIHIFTSATELRKFVSNPSDPAFVFSTDAFQYETESIVIKPAQTEYITIPAVEEVVTEHVVVQEAATELMIVPASYKTVTETVEVAPEMVEYVNVPAKFKTENKTIVISPARGGKPAVTETLQVKKLVSPAQTVEKTIPARFEQVTRRVVEGEGKTMERVVPAMTRVESRRVVTTPAQVVTREVAAETVTVRRLVPTQPVNTSPGLIEDKFVWPSTNSMQLFTPPKTDIKIDIPNSTCGYVSNNSDPSLMDVFKNFSGLLNKYQYPKRVFKYKHGFAILTSPERISEEAKNILDAKQNRRIKLDQHPINDIGSYLQILFTKPATRYRYLAFIITADDNVQGTDKEATPEGLQAIFTQGGLDSDLPDSMRNHAFTTQYKCQVWVYEFSRIDRDDPTVMEGDLFVPAAPTLSEFAHKAGSPVLKALFETNPK